MNKLEDWYVVVDNNPYLAPELLTYRLAGKTHNDPRFENGENVFTSHIVMLDVGERVAKTKNTTYYLGAPATAWLEWLFQNNYRLDMYNKKGQSTAMKASLHAPREQQLEGLKWVLTQVSFLQLHKALDILEHRLYVSSSQRKKILADARHILNIKYQRKYY